MAVASLPGASSSSDRSSKVRAELIDIFRTRSSLGQQLGFALAAKISSFSFVPDNKGHPFPTSYTAEPLRSLSLDLFQHNTLYQTHHQSFRLHTHTLDKMPFKDGTSTLLITETLFCSSPLSLEITFLPHASGPRAPEHSRPAREPSSKSFSQIRDYVPHAVTPEAFSRVAFPAQPQSRLTRGRGLLMGASLGPLQRSRA